jgi:ABC-2 type transport system ATP-binding protein
MAVPIVAVGDLVKEYPGGIRAVDGITFEVSAGEFLGFLGPNGAGKTTTIRILATLTRPTSGTARVTGLDVVERPAEVRRRIGLAMQSVAIEGLATGRENLELIGRLHRMPGPELRRRVDELLELMNLTEAAGRLAATYSGGMRRRLDLATALLHRPEVLFLDEPTEGLDPQSRNALWEELRAVNQSGTTMFLTTHYMEEADRLCGRIAIIDEGRIVVEGSPAALKAAVASDVVAIHLAGDELAIARQQVDVIRLLDGFEPLTRTGTTSSGVLLYLADAPTAIAEIVRRVDRDGVRIASLTMTQPSLDDVFLEHTGRHIRPEAPDQSLSGYW